MLLLMGLLSLFVEGPLVLDKKVSPGIGVRADAVGLCYSSPFPAADVVSARITLRIRARNNTRGAIIVSRTPGIDPAKVALSPEQGSKNHIEFEFSPDDFY